MANTEFKVPKVTEPRMGAEVISILSGLAVMIGGLFLPWLVATETRPELRTGQTGLMDLFRFRFSEDVSLFASVGLLLAVLGLIMIIGGGAALRALTAIASVLALVVGALWIINADQNFADSALALEALRIGAWLTLGGGLLGLFSSLFLRHRIRANQELVYYEDQVA